MRRPINSILYVAEVRPNFQKKLKHKIDVYKNKITFYYMC